MKVRGLRDSEAYKLAVIYRSPIYGNTTKVKEMYRIMASMMSREQLEEFFVEGVDYLDKLETDLTHLDERNYGLDLRIDKGTPSLTTLKMVVNDFLGYTKRKDLSDEVNKEWRVFQDIRNKIVTQLGWKEDG